MAQASKRLKRARREKQYISLMERDARHVNQEMKQIKQQLFNTNLILLSVLSQQGGEVTVTQGTFQQVVEQGPRLGWQSGLGPTVEGQAPEFIVRVMTQEDGSPEPLGIVHQVVKDSPIQDTVPSSEDTTTGSVGASTGAEDILDGTPI